LLEKYLLIEGHPGVETCITTENGSVSKAVPTSGVSMGQYEAKFALDGGSH